MENTKDILMIILGALVFLAFLGATGYLLVTGRNDDILNSLIIALITAFTSVLSYYFGSSKGSADKNKMIKNGGQNA